MEATKTAYDIVRTYIKLAKKHRVHPGRSLLKQNGISRDQLRHHFGNLNGLKQAAREHDPNAFDGILDDDVVRKQRIQDLHEDLGRYRRFVITTAVGGHPVHAKFYNSIKSYCEARSAKLLVLRACDPGSDGDYAVSPKLTGEHIVFEDVALNSNIFISTIKLSAKQIDPVTSLGRIGQREGSFVYASPKQRLETVPTSNEKMPHVLVTTGAITKPSYAAKEYTNERTAYIANHDHVVGALIVEVVDDKFYHFRHVQADRSGGFVDLGIYYSAKPPRPLPPAALVIGDSHVTETDPTAESAWEEVVRCTGAKTVVLHDMFSGVSINHHEENNRITKAVLALQNKLSLLDELKAVAEYLNKWTERVDLVVVVESNHHEFLSKHYLEKAKYVEDPQNHLLGLQLAAAMVQGHNPLRYALEHIVGLNNPEKVLWLNRDQDYKVAGIELGSHGDKGANGSRGSLRAMENAYANSVSGHGHTPRIIRGAWQVGTSSYLKLRYNQGPSSWMHASCLVYDHQIDQPSKCGARQMIFSINGSWQLE
jgi:hypothetical protein